jgi:sugar/nucleoside kinase (ribokinase family)
MPPATQPDVICIGSVLWDIIGRVPGPMKPGADMGGRITRLPGGVAMNVAMALRRLGLTPTVLTAIGTDADGVELIAACDKLGVSTDHVYRSSELPTDRYMAIEDSNGLIAAIGDAHSLEAVGGKILVPLMDGRLGSAETPWTGLVVLDCNVNAALVAEIAVSPYLAAADLRVAPASPSKVGRLRPLLSHPRATFYVNLEEAGLLCGQTFPDSATAAAGLLASGARRALVTGGGRLCADACAVRGSLTSQPPAVTVQRVTGAGDTFMAAHIVADRRNEDRSESLASALRVAATYVSGEIGS